jgi:hypothetical protein
VADDAERKIVFGLPKALGSLIVDPGHLYPGFLSSDYSALLAIGGYFYLERFLPVHREAKERKKEDIPTWTLFKHDPADIVPVVLTTNFLLGTGPKPEDRREAWAYGYRTEPWLESFPKSCESDGLRYRIF